ncbi:DUF2200 family protein [Sinorhizobium meliloti]|uniref:DUF2200 family protein n=1 Tax=Rhizobium meliloti TaxID=382 RepID=UPI001F2E1A40|nr:DUF2200 family protein [Sinorhizobium meliloti]
MASGSSTDETGPPHRIPDSPTGYGPQALDDQLAKSTSLENFFAQAPRMNPSRSLITGVICGVRVEEIQDTTMREIRYLDKLIDELAKGKAMDKILRK